MTEDRAARFSIKIPGNIDYIPPVRKYIADLIGVCGFGDKFVFRSEVIIDELCNNAVSHGSVKVDAAIDIVCTVFGDKIELKIKDEGGSHRDKSVLDSVLNGSGNSSMHSTARNIGLEIVRLLSEKVSMEIDEKEGLTTIHVIRSCEGSEKKI